MRFSRSFLPRPPEPLETVRPLVFIFSTHPPPFHTQRIHVWVSTLYGVRLAIMVVLANVVHDAYRHLFSPEGIKRATAIQTNLTGSRWVIAVLESALIRMFSESGRTVGMMERGEVTMLGRRFDWFTEKLGDGPRREERWNSAVRLVVIGVFMVASMLIL